MTQLKTIPGPGGAGAIPVLDTKAIASLLGCTRQHATSRVTKRADFPHPVVNVSRRIRYWREADVRGWMTRQ